MAGRFIFEVWELRKLMVDLTAGAEAGEEGSRVRIRQVSRAGGSISVRFAVSEPHPQVPATIAGFGPDRISDFILVNEARRQVLPGETNWSEKTLNMHRRVIAGSWSADIQALAALGDELDAWLKDARLARVRVVRTGAFAVEMGPLPVSEGPTDTPAFDPPAEAGDGGEAAGAENG